ncbi:MAG: non-canonical purine NTP pyrophosphatase [Eubacteriales bacterium]|nr:non-canonical purine NTP pyrophosphatase [Eubacteriales bacterium]
MKILYGTGNPAKLNVMKKKLAPLNIEVIGLEHMEAPPPRVAEDGVTPLENAVQKATAYYQAFRMPVFSCDSGLDFRKAPQRGRDQKYRPAYPRTRCG